MIFVLNNEVQVLKMSWTQRWSCKSLNYHCWFSFIVDTKISYTWLKLNVQILSFIARCIVCQVRGARYSPVDMVASREGGREVEK